MGVSGLQGSGGTGTGQAPGRKKPKKGKKGANKALLELQEDDGDYMASTSI